MAHRFSLKYRNYPRQVSCELKFLAGRHCWTYQRRVAPRGKPLPLRVSLSDILVRQFYLSP